MIFNSVIENFQNITKKNIKNISYENQRKKFLQNFAFYSLVTFVRTHLRKVVEL